MEINAQRLNYTMQFADGRAKVKRYVKQKSAKFRGKKYKFTKAEIRVMKNALKKYKAKKYKWQKDKYKPLLRKLRKK
jgi:hypothetical protein